MLVSAPVVADAQGNVHRPASAGARVASLVPSITELLLELGLGAQVVARTGYCIHPAEAVAGIAKVGGTKDVNLPKLRSLAPEYVIVNIDENRRETAQELAQFVPYVVVTHPKKLADNMELFRLCGYLFAATPGVKEAALRLENALREQLRASAAAHAAPPSLRALYLIWQDPWMTVSAQTYVADVLAWMGAQVVPVRGADAQERYPAFALSDVDWDACDIVLLSSEPYRFGPEHQAALAKEITALSGRRIPVELVDGEPFSWYGSRSLTALPYGQALLRDWRARHLIAN